MKPCFPDQTIQRAHILSRHQQGSTLIEVIVAIFVLSFGVLALMLAQLGAVNTSINAANQAEVTRAVQNYIEIMRAEPKMAARAFSHGSGKEETRVSYLVFDYSNFNTSGNDCVNKLGLHLSNTPTISKCEIKNGQITVSWQGQNNRSDDQNDNNFTYSLSVNDGSGSNNDQPNADSGSSNNQPNDDSDSNNNQP
ncbi:prepilin-type N-terminal cleavage/methylation domain-containing protein [Neisseriaceae bacterium ESL0693]|nr:prepilin-type N-terminal cleavage/methylation domain-containing protein [Neisseriaceae bacterium ESL0693]